jgi:hypothetical protein
MSLLKSAGWMLAGILGYLLMIVSGLVLLSAFFLTPTDLTATNVAVLVVCVLVFLLGFYLHFKNVRQ